MVLHIDPFDKRFMDDPYPHYRAMREAEPVLWSPKYECYVVARHGTCNAMLSEWQTFSSAAGVGSANSTRKKPWRPPSIVLEADPPLHTRTRTDAGAHHDARRRARPARRFRTRSGNSRRPRSRHGDVRRGSVISPSATDQVFSRCARPAGKGTRETSCPTATWCSTLFGPRNELTEAASPMPSVRGWIMANCAREALTKDGLGAMIYAAVDSGELNEDEGGHARPLLPVGRRRHDGQCFRQHDVGVSRPSPTNGRSCASRTGAQRLRGEPALRGAPAAGVLPARPRKETEIGGVKIDANEKICAFMHVGPTATPTLGQRGYFRHRTPRSSGMGLGTGIHGCVGQPIARLEGEVVFAALAQEPIRRNPDASL